MPDSTIQERLGWEITPERYRQVRALWITHSKAEDARDLVTRWDLRHEKFAGQRIYFDRTALAAVSGA